MHPILFYCNRQGRVPVREYLDELANKNNKDSRIGELSS